jgi:hypothetical protein
MAAEFSRRILQANAAESLLPVSDTKPSLRMQNGCPWRVLGRFDAGTYGEHWYCIKVTLCRSAPALLHLQTIRGQLKRDMI